MRHEPPVYSGETVKKASVIALVVLLLVVGLPLAMGMSGMAPCPSCTGVEPPVAVAMCLAIVSLLVLIVSLRSSRIASRPQLVRLLLLSDPPERPPQIA